MSSVKLAHINVLNDAGEGRQIRVSEQVIRQQAGGVSAIYGRDAAPDPAARRETFTRAAELEPEPTKVVTQTRHADKLYRQPP